MKVRGRLFWLAAFGILVGSLLPQAFADNITFTEGNHHLADEQNILFHAEQVGSSIMGFTNVSDTGVEFSSTTDVLIGHGGQAAIHAQDGEINDITITVPGHDFAGFVFNAFEPVNNNDLPVTVLDVDGNHFTYQFGSQHGENFLSIVDGSGDGIASITIDSPGGFAELRQNRIGDISAGSTPEPSSWLLLGSGVVAVAGALRRRK